MMRPVKNASPHGPPARHQPRTCPMDRRTITIDPVATKLRRVGRLARRRMRIEGDAFTHGTHTDGSLPVRISGLGSPVAGVPDSFEWKADRPVALVIIRS